VRDTTPQAVQACHGLLLWLVLQLDRFPRVRRLTLGERLETALLEVLDRPVEAAYSRAKEDALRRANRRADDGRRFARRLRAMAQAYASGCIAWAEIHASVQS
jgi:hypothetical protein